MNWAIVARFFFFWLFILAAGALGPAAIAQTGAERDAFLIGAAVAGFVGAAGALAAPKRNPNGTRFREGLMIGVAIWVGSPAFAAIPIALSGADPFHAYFDALSALTTTGMWLEPDAVYNSRAQILWRAQLSWIGGFATLAIVAAVLLRREFGGVRVRTPSVFGAGERGVAPAIARLAGAFLLPYTALTAASAVLLFFSGAPRFDSVVLALGAISTGGVIPSPERLADYPPLVHAVLMVSTVFGAISFFLAALLITGRRPKLDEESRAFLVLIPVLALLFAVHSGASALRTFGDSFFNAASVLSTYGWTLGDAPPLTPALVAACVGGSVISTAGGLKVARWLTVFRRARRELRRIAHPEAVTPRARNADALGVWVHFTAFVLVLSALTLVLAADGSALPEATRAAVAAFANTGPLAEAPDAPFAQAALALGMALGRIDTVAALALLSPAFWRS